MLVSMLFMQHRGTHNGMLTNCWKTSAHRNSQFRSLEYETSTACVRSKWDMRGPLPFLQARGSRKNPILGDRNQSLNTPRCWNCLLVAETQYHSISSLALRAGRTTCFWYFAMITLGGAASLLAYKKSLFDATRWFRAKVTILRILCADAQTYSPNWMIFHRAHVAPSKIISFSSLRFRRNMVLAVGRLARRLGNPLPSWHMPPLVGKLKLGYTVPPKKNILGRDNEMVNHG